MNNSFNIEKTYIYANSQILAQHDGDYEDDRYFYIHDRLGSVRQVINESGSVVRYYTYKPFGEVLEEDGSFDNPFMFTGQYYDSEVAQYYLRARMYDPHIGRFTSRDPVSGKFKEPMTLHAYLYCLNDPVNYIDPSGKFYWFADMLFNNALYNSLRTMDYKFHMAIFNKSASKIDAFSVINIPPSSKKAAKQQGQSYTFDKIFWLSGKKLKELIMDSLA